MAQDPSKKLMARIQQLEKRLQTALDDKRKLKEKFKLDLAKAKDVAFEKGRASIKKEVKSAAQMVSRLTTDFEKALNRLSGKGGPKKSTSKKTTAKKTSAKKPAAPKKAARSTQATSTTTKRRGRPPKKSES